MNLFLRLGDEIITPPLGGSILPGITRDTTLRLLESWGTPAVQRPVSIDEVREAHAKGVLHEVFGTGTAAVISPVKELFYKGEALQVGDGTMGAVSTRLYETITGMQYGDLPDPHGWVREVPEA
jgi:branched-chain amino acid aminotransferase